MGSYYERKGCNSPVLSIKKPTIKASNKSPCMIHYLSDYMYSQI
jgi:hypothetical protein